MGTARKSAAATKPATPVEATIHLILQRATQAGASHVHIEPRGGYGVVRQRVGGALEVSTKLPGRAVVDIVDYFKRVGGLDVSHRHMPQTGRHSLSLGRRHYELELGTLPLVNGESLNVHFVTTKSKRTAPVRKRS